jgi:hypothetical protein
VFVLSVDGLPGADVSRVVGESGLPVFRVGPDTIQSFRIFVTLRDDSIPQSSDITFVIEDRETGQTATTESTFKAKRP